MDSYSQAQILWVLERAILDRKAIETLGGWAGIGLPTSVKHQHRRGHQ